jgi:hypothetical protein
MNEDQQHQEAPVEIVPATQPTTALVRPVAGVRDIGEAFQEYRRLSEQILERSDRMHIGQREFIKRSGWRKLATAYGVNLEVLPQNVVVDRDEYGRILRATVYARATAPNGRYADGVGVCDRHERCCQGEPCRMKHREGGHCRTGGKACQLAHFSNAEHDIPATASTRAMNRAASDLFGLGEVSAEEIGEQAEPEPALITAEQLAEVLSMLGPAGMTRESLEEGYGKALEELSEAGAALLLDRMREVARANTQAEVDQAGDEGVGDAGETDARPIENPL